MGQYVEEIFQEPDVINDFAGLASTPAAMHLFTTNAEEKKLGAEQGTVCHHLVAKVSISSKEGS